MKNVLLAIAVPAIAVYCYAATILTNYGFLTYFGVPSSFVQSSLSENIVFFYQLFSVYGSIISETRWYFGVAIGFAIGVIIFLSWYDRRFKTIVITVGIIGLLLYLSTFYQLGKLLAANSTKFVMASNCSIGSASTYIIPVIDGGTTVLIPLDQNRKMLGGFLVKNTADLACTFAWKDIGGKITP